jgi:hypothetical protein
VFQGADSAEPDIRKTVRGFCEATVNAATGKERTGCMMAAAALGQSERVAESRSYFARGLKVSADLFAQRFEQEIHAGRLSERVPPGFEPGLSST